VNIPASASVATSDIAERAQGYGIPGVVVDGNDVLAVYKATTDAVARARAGEGPTLIECKTYRHRRHTERADQPDVRTQAEIDGWMEKDPIDTLVQLLTEERGELTAEEWAEMDKQILASIEASVDFAKASPFPKPEAALDDVFAS